MRRILLGVGPAGGAVEDIIGREVDQSSVHLPAGEREIAHAEGIGEESGLRLALSDIDLVIGGGVENDAGIKRGERFLDEFPVVDIDCLAGKSLDGVAPRLQLSNQLDTQLTGTAEDYRTF